MRAFTQPGALLVLMRSRDTRFPTVSQWRNALVAGCLMHVGGMGLPGVVTQTMGSGPVGAMIALVQLLESGRGLLWGKCPTRLV
jgi:hypothetical protein